MKQIHKHQLERSGILNTRHQRPFLKCHEEDRGEAMPLTLWQCGLVNDGAPGAGELVHVQPDGKLVLGVWLQTLNQHVRF